MPAPGEPPRRRSTAVDGHGIVRRRTDPPATPTVTATPTANTTAARADGHGPPIASGTPTARGLAAAQRPTTCPTASTHDPVGPRLRLAGCGDRRRPLVGERRLLIRGGEYPSGLPGGVPPTARFARRLGERSGRLPADWLTDGFDGFWVGTIRRRLPFARSAGNHLDIAAAGRRIPLHRHRRTRLAADLAPGPSSTRPTAAPTGCGPPAPRATR